MARRPSDLEIYFMDFEEIKKRAVEVQVKYNALNAEKGKKWGAREYTEGLVGDVGDLMKLMQAREGYRDKGDHDAKIKHELSDCLWAVIVIADQLGIDLEKDFLIGMNALDERIKSGKI
ncbi:MAG: nucleotide pyrophosphohydrolase [bacterium]